MKTWLSEDQKFGIGASVIFVGAFIVLQLLYGCASVFDAPPEPAKVIQMHGAVLKFPVVCAIVYDRTPWLMTVNVGECQGWIPI